MTADEAVEVFWRAVEAGHFRDLEERLRAERTEAYAHEVVYREPLEVVAAFRERTAELLGLDPASTWVDGLLAQGWAL